MKPVRDHISRTAIRRPLLRRYILYWTWLLTFTGKLLPSNFFFIFIGNIMTMAFSTIFIYLEEVDFEKTCSSFPEQHLHLWSREHWGHNYTSKAFNDFDCKVLFFYKHLQACWRDPLWSHSQRFGRVCQGKAPPPVWSVPLQGVYRRRSPQVCGLLHSDRLSSRGVCLRWSRTHPGVLLQVPCPQVRERSFIKPPPSN